MKHILILVLFLIQISLKAQTSDSLPHNNFIINVGIDYNYANAKHYYEYKNSISPKFKILCNLSNNSKKLKTYLGIEYLMDRYKWENIIVTNNGYWLINNNKRTIHKFNICYEKRLSYKAKKTEYSFTIGSLFQLPIQYVKYNSQYGGITNYNESYADIKPYFRFDLMFYTNNKYSLGLSIDKALFSIEQILYSYDKPKFNFQYVLPTESFNYNKAGISIVCLF